MNDFQAAGALGPEGREGLVRLPDVPVRGTQRPEAVYAARVGDSTRA